MMLDTNDLPDEHLLTADLCIIGAGAAGITLALEFIGSNLDALVLESGGKTKEQETQALYAGSIVYARLHSPPARYRQRRFGATPTIWDGRCLPFDEIDFEARDYVPYSGWPFSRQELLPY